MTNLIYILQYTYNPPPMIGFEAFQQPQEQSDV